MMSDRFGSYEYEFNRIDKLISPVVWEFIVGLFLTMTVDHCDS